MTENTTAVTTVTASDIDNDAVTYSITGATADDNLFSITPGGVLTFDTAPDFENPSDIGGDNVCDPIGGSRPYCSAIWTPTHCLDILA